MLKKLIIGNKFGVTQRNNERIPANGTKSHRQQLCAKQVYNSVI
jgi:hypothetical protein